MSSPQLFVDPIKKMSIAWFSSQDIPLDGSRFEATLKMVEEIRALKKNAFCFNSFMPFHLRHV